VKGALIMKNENIHILKPDFIVLSDEELLKLALKPFSDENYINLLINYISPENFDSIADKTLFKALKKKEIDTSKPIIELFGDKRLLKCFYINTLGKATEEVNQIKEYHLYTDKAVSSGLGIFYVELKAGVTARSSKVKAIKNLVIHKFIQLHPYKYTSVLIAIRAEDEQYWQLAYIAEPSWEKKAYRFTVSILCDAWLLLKSDFENLPPPSNCIDVYSFQFNPHIEVSEATLFDHIANLEPE
jgi:hypothetical protein